METLAVILAPWLITAMAVTGHPPQPDLGYWEEARRSRPDLELRWGESFEYAGVVIRRLSFAGSTWQGRPQRVFALYGQPAGPGPFPAVLQIHGGTQTAYPANVAWFVQHGFACLSFDWTGPHLNRPDDEVTHWDGPVAWNFFGKSAQADEDYLLRHVVLACLAGIDALAAQPAVRRPSIGIQGVSWGGFIGWAVGGLDDRVKAIVPVYGVGSLARHEGGVGEELRALGADLLEAWTRRFDPEAWAQRVRAPLFLLNGTNDFYGVLAVGEERLKQVAARGVPVWRSYSPNRSHNLSPESVDAAMAWLAAQLGSDPEPFPREPTIELVAEHGQLWAIIHPDIETRVEDVAVDFSRGEHSWLLRAWLRIPAEPVGAGKWRAPIPLVHLSDPVEAIGQVRYRELGMLSTPVARTLPSLVPGLRPSEVSSDTLIDWGSRPESWYIVYATDFFHTRMPQTTLTTATLGAEQWTGITFDPWRDLNSVRIATRLAMDPGRNAGGRRRLEITLHDVKEGIARVNEQIRKPGEITYEARFHGGAGWNAIVLSPTDLTSVPPAVANQADVHDLTMPDWNKAYQLDLHLVPLAGGRPAVGRLRWLN